MSNNHLSVVALHINYTSLSSNAHFPLNETSSKHTSPPPPPPSRAERAFDDEGGSAGRGTISIRVALWCLGGRGGRDQHCLCCARARSPAVDAPRLQLVYIRPPRHKQKQGVPGHRGGMEGQGRDELRGPVLHIAVVGFHHKRGCQVHEPLLHAS